MDFSPARHDAMPDVRAINDALLAAGVDLVAYVHFATELELNEVGVEV